MVQSALTTRTAITTDRSSRNGAKITSIGHHHAASTSLEGTLLQFQPGGREVSPNYCIEGKNIVLVVPEEYRAWTSGDAWADGQSITYEIINSSTSPDWRFSADTIASVIALDIDVCRRYGIAPKWGLPGLWQHRNLYEWFQRSYATACAGPSFPQDYIVSQVAIGLAGGIASIGRKTMYLVWAEGTGYLVTEDGFHGLASPQIYNLFFRLINSKQGNSPFVNGATPEIFNKLEIDMMKNQLALLRIANGAQTVVDGPKLAAAIADELQKIGIPVTVENLADADFEVDQAALAAAFDAATPRVAAAILRQAGSALAQVPAA